MNNQYDVIIVGGGPSGLSAASFLSDQGYNTAVFDQSNEIGNDAVCSGVISKEAYDRYDLPSNPIVATLRYAELVSPSGNIIDYAHPEDAVVVVDRHKFDFELGVIAQNKGAQINSNSKVKSVVNGKHYAVVEVEKDGEVKVYKSDIVILATGVRFNLHNMLGFGRPKKILKGIQVEVEEKLNDKLKICWGSRYSEGFFGWSIPLETGRTRVGVMTEGNSINGLENLLNDLGYRTHLNDTSLNIKKRGISFGSAINSMSDRIIAIGEAAGYIKTTTGGGIFYGILSAELASEVIDKCFVKRDFSAKALSEYCCNCNSVFGKEIKYGKYFHSFFSKLDDDSIDNLFYAVKEDGFLNFISNKASFDWHRGVVTQILKSPNLRRVLLSGFISNGLKLAI